MTAPLATDHALSAEEIAAFVRDGYLLLRGCIDPDHAAELVRRSLVSRTPPPRLGRRTGDGAAEVDPNVDLLDPSTWGARRLDVVAGLGLSIAEISPRLWGAIQSLVAPRAPSRTLLGEQWILNGDYVEPSAPETVPADLAWHIDTPDTATTFEDWQDALVLLVLWSDVVPGGGGPYFSGQSLDLLVERIDASPAGVDTTGQDWARAIAARVADGREFTGRAGDVLITHPFSLHSASENRARRVRILENPTITVSRALDYSHENPSPSAVESAVIRRRAPLRGARPLGFAAGARWLVARHPDYFLPRRTEWEKRVDAEERARVHALDAALHAHFVTRVARRIARTRPEPLAAALGCVAVARHAVVNQRVVHADLRENLHDPDFADTGFARLARGFVNCEGQSWLLLSLLRHFFPRAELFETLDPVTGRSSHTLVHVETDAGWFFADAWSDFPVFHVAERGGTPLPGVPEHGELGARGALASHGLHPRSHFVGGHVVPFPTSNATSTLEAPAGESASERSTWEEYLEVRVAHLAGRPEAAERYAALLGRRRLGGLTGQVVRALQERARNED